MIDRHFIGDQSPIGCKVVSKQARIVCNLSPTCLHITASFYHKYSTFQVFIVLSVALLSVELGRRPEKLYNQQKIELQHFYLFFAGGATTAALLLRYCQLAEKSLDSERLTLYMHFVLISDRSTNSHRTVATSQPNIPRRQLVTDVFHCMYWI